MSDEQVRNVDSTGHMNITVRHITRDEAERMSDQWSAGMRWLIVECESPENVHYERAMLGIPSGTEYLIGAIKLAREMACQRQHRLILTPEMAAFEAAKDGLELAVKKLAVMEMAEVAGLYGLG